MVQTEVGVGELGKRLSVYLRRVEAGETIIITKRGRPIGRIVPWAQFAEAQLEALSQAGLIAWSGRKLQAVLPVAQAKKGSNGGRLASRGPRVTQATPMNDAAGWSGAGEVAQLGDDAELRHGPCPHSSLHTPAEEGKENPLSPRPWERPRLRFLAREMRRHPTPAEDRLWQALRKRRGAGFKFRRQKIVAPFIVDFYCAKAKLVVEVDSPIHRDDQEEDAMRQRYLESLGLKVLRFSNDEILTSLNEVLDLICIAVEDSISATPRA